MTADPGLRFESCRGHQADRSQPPLSEVRPSVRGARGDLYGAADVVVTHRVVDQVARHPFEQDGFTVDRCGVQLRVQREGPCGHLVGGAADDVLDDARHIHLVLFAGTGLAAGQRQETVEGALTVFDRGQQGHHRECDRGLGQELGQGGVPPPAS